MTQKINTYFGQPETLILAAVDFLEKYSNCPTFHKIIEQLEIEQIEYDIKTIRANVTNFVEKSESKIKSLEIELNHKRKKLNDQTSEN